MIRMLKSFIGSHHFTAGMRSYLQKHAYSNAQTDELWESMSEVSYDVIDFFQALPFYDTDDLKPEALFIAKIKISTELYYLLVLLGKWHKCQRGYGHLDITDGFSSY